MENTITIKNTFTPANEQQNESIHEVINFINVGNSREWFLLSGKAGVGKTTVITQILKPFLGKKRIMLSALSHKAKKVILSKVKETYGGDLRGIYSGSVAGILGMTVDMETGKFVKIYTKKKPPIKNMDVIIVDECSMINEEGLRLIMSEKKPDAKVIFCGDIGQLPPIRENSDEHSGQPSPTFNTTHKYELFERVRQESDSSVLEYSDYYWDNSVLSSEPVDDPVPFEKRVSDDWISFETDFKDTILKNKDLLLEMVKTKNLDLIKVIVYRNKTKDGLNWFIRNLLFNDPKEYEVGDVLIFNDNYVEDDEILIENSTEVSVLSIKNVKFDMKWSGYVLTVTDGECTWDIKVLSNDSVGEYNKHISELFAKAKKLPLGRERTRQLKNAWSSKKRFADISHGYVISSHKSQGSTYKSVILIEDDIMNVSLISNVEKSQSMYVGLTRTSDKLFIVSELN